jgi:predicted transglutaminase-like protease
MIAPQSVKVIISAIVTAQRAVASDIKWNTLLEMGDELTFRKVLWIFHFGNELTSQDIEVRKMTSTQTYRGDCRLPIKGICYIQER